MTAMPPPVVTTNLLALPLLALIVETGNSEDWIESIKYIVDESTDSPETNPQVDLRGIDFEMEVRRTTKAHEVVLTASSSDGSIAIGEPPDYGFLIINVGFDEMKELSAGDYVADIRGKDDRYTRICIQIALTVFDGITR